MLTTSVRGIEELTVLFDKVEELTEVERVLDEAGAILLNRVRSRFLKQVDPNGVPWLPSRAAEIRKKTGRGGGTLFDSGNLWRSLQLSNRGEGVRAIETDIPYARKHQEGLDGMEKRVFLGFGGNDADVVRKLLVDRIRRA